MYKVHDRELYQSYEEVLTTELVPSASVELASESSQNNLHFGVYTCTHSVSHLLRVYASNARKEFPSILCVDIWIHTFDLSAANSGKLGGVLERGYLRYSFSNYRSHKVNFLFLSNRMCNLFSSNHSVYTTCTQWLHRCHVPSYAVCI